MTEATEWNNKTDQTRTKKRFLEHIRKDDMMKRHKNDFCFCTLALGGRYRALARQLAEDIARLSPGTEFVILTDKPEDFAGCDNVAAFKHKQKGIYSCFNDRRFVAEKALTLHETAIHVDSDTRLVGQVPDDIAQHRQISGCSEGLIEHVSRYRPERLERFRKIASKIGVNIEDAKWIGESLWIISRDGGREREFIRQ